MPIYSFINYSSRYLAIALSVGTMMVTAHSALAVLTEVGNTQWNDNNVREISVFPGNSYIDAFLGNPGPGISVFKSLGTVAEYNFFNEAGSSDVIQSYASSGSRIGLATTTDTGIANQQLVANSLYTISDPLSGIPNFTSATHVNGLSGNTTGTIDVTGLESGTLFFLIGSNGAEGRANSLTVTQGTSSIVTAESGGGYFQSGGTGFWANGDTISVAVEVAFTNTGYDNSITYDFSKNNAGKFMGVVLADVDGGGSNGPDPIPGDFNGNGTVDAADYTLYADNVGQTDELAFAPGTGDGMNGVDTADYELWRTNFGISGPLLRGGAGGAIPEPSTVALLAGGLSLGLIAIRKFRN